MEYHNYLHQAFNPKSPNMVTLLISKGMELGIICALSWICFQEKSLLGISPPNRMPNS